MLLETGDWKPERQWSELYPPHLCSRILRDQGLIEGHLPSRMDEQTTPAKIACSVPSEFPKSWELW